MIRFGQRFAAIAACVAALPQYALLANEIAILALFAISLDLVLGYAGIVSLGHTAFFGVGAYVCAYQRSHHIDHARSSNRIA
mgnify:CR=1 FL=1